MITTYWWLIPIIIWDLAWKAVAAWRAAKQDNKIWFILLLLLNTVGILPIIYIATHKERA